MLTAIYVHRTIDQWCTRCHHAPYPLNTNSCWATTWAVHLQKVLHAHHGAAAGHWLTPSRTTNGFPAVVLEMAVHYRGLCAGTRFDSERLGGHTMSALAVCALQAQPPGPLRPVDRACVHIVTGSISSSKLGYPPRFILLFSLIFLHDCFLRKGCPNTNQNCPWCPEPMTWMGWDSHRVIHQMRISPTES